MGSPLMGSSDSPDLDDMASATSQEQSSSQDFFAPTQQSRSSPIIDAKECDGDVSARSRKSPIQSSALHPLFFADDEDEDAAMDVQPDLKALGESSYLKRSRSISNDEDLLPAKSVRRSKPATPEVPQQTVELEVDGESDEWERRYLGSFVMRALTLSENVREGTRVRLWHTAAKELPAPKNAAPAFFRSKQQTSNEDYVVYMDDVKTGKRMARTSANEGKWMVKLIDQKLASFEGSVVVGPQSKSRLADIYIQVKAYILRSAFQRPDHTAPPAVTALKETQSTTEERKIRARKRSLAQLFKKCALKPRIRDGQTNVEISEPTSPSGSPSDTTQMIDVDAIDDDLTESQVEQLYKASKAARLPQVDPPDTFAMELRPYQKQALGWMKKMEQPIGSNVADVHGQQLLDPLWREYDFPFNDNVDEQAARDNKELLEAKARKFYFSPSTGEISIRFVETKHTARGGILADEMGLGKTIMMASLIHSETPDSAGLTAQLKADIEAAKERVGARDEKDASVRSKVTELRHANLVRRCTLVVAPMSLVGQWVDELNRASRPNSLGIVQHYGNADTRKELFKRMRVEEADVVVTSYGMVTSEHKTSGRSSDLFKYKWHRVILDEAHTIRNRATVGARACFDLEAERRFVLTGSPIINKLSDLFSLLCFLRVRPWGTFDIFNAFIGKPFEQKSPQALEVVKVVLDSVLLRREKSMTDEDGKPIVDIPSKKLVIKHLSFSDTERAIYDKIYSQAQIQYQQMQGSAKSFGGYARIFAVLMRLRQAVCHPLLLVKNGGIEGDVDDKGEGFVHIDSATRKLINTFHAGDGPDADVDGAASAVEELMQSLQKTESLKTKANGKDTKTSPANIAKDDDDDDDDDDTCPLCFEDSKAVLVYLPCGHRFCKECILDHFQRCEQRDVKGTCPTCRHGPINETDLIEMVRKRKRVNPIAQVIGGDDDEGGNDYEPHTEECDEGGPPLSQGSVFFQRNSFRSSTKLEALIKDLNQLRLDEPDAKAVVFSQFTSFLDIVEVVLKRNRHAFVRLDGSMTQAQRVKVIKRFTDSQGPLIMLISLKAGGVGLNLTAAHHVWLLDCWWAAAIEAQAIDRVHRIGALKEVIVHRYLISDSIEDRIMQIQRRKTALTQGALIASAEQRDENETEENLRLMFDD